MVLHYDCLVIRVFGELAGNLLSQQLAAWEGVGGESHRPADSEGLWQDGCVRHLMGDAEGHEPRRMGVDDAVKPRAHLVKSPVKRIFR